jgi:hypothetical protein
MKAFIGNYGQTFGRGAYVDHFAVIFAEEESVALGLALEEYPDTIAKHWDFEEIDPTIAGAHHLCTNEN